MEPNDFGFIVLIFQTQYDQGIFTAAKLVLHARYGKSFHIAYLVALQVYYGEVRFPWQQGGKWKQRRHPIESSKQDSNFFLTDVSREICVRGEAPTESYEGLQLELREPAKLRRMQTLFAFQLG